MKSDEWITQSGKLRSTLSSRFEALFRITQNESVWKALIDYKERVIEKEIKVAFGKYIIVCKIYDSACENNAEFFSLERPTDRMLSVNRRWKNKQSSADVERLKSLVQEKIPVDNQVMLE